MAAHQLNTVFYKNQRFAAGKLVLYMVFAVAFFFVALGNAWLMVIWALSLLVPPLIAAVKRKSIFNLKYWDDRPLVLTPEFIRIGAEQFNFTDIQTVAIYLGGYKGFKHYRGSHDAPVNGDDNVLAFRHQGKTRSVEFFIRDYHSYVTMCHIIDAWKNSGKSFVLKEAFSRDYIREQMRLNQN